jgi:hypothetical protein
VILRNGRIIFTRMTQPVGEGVPEVVAGNIEQEMLGTVEYMRRLSFDPQMGLDIYIIAAANIRSLIDPLKFGANVVHIMTPYEVSECIGIEGATQPSDQFGDVVLASMIGSSRKHILTLMPPEFQKLNSLYGIRQAARTTMALGIAGLLVYGGMNGYEWLMLSGGMEDVQNQKQAKLNKLNELKTKTTELDIDLDKASDLITLYKKTQEGNSSPLPLLAKLEPMLESPVRAKAFLWELDPAIKTPPFKATNNFTLEFPSLSNDPEVFNSRTKGVLELVKTGFKGYEVSYTSFPTNPAESDKLDIAIDGNQSKAPEVTAVATVVDVKMLIKGNADVSLDSGLPAAAPPSPNSR